MGRRSTGSMPAHLQSSHQTRRPQIVRAFPAPAQATTGRAAAPASLETAVAAATGMRAISPRSLIPSRHARQVLSSSQAVWYADSPRLAAMWFALERARNSERMQSAVSYEIASGRWLPFLRVGLPVAGRDLRTCASEHTSSLATRHAPLVAYLPLSHAGSARRAAQESGAGGRSERSARWLTRMRWSRR
jgi:hypothetical protein